MLFRKSDFELPCVGDWIIFQPFDENKGIIVDMLPRERILFRKKIGTMADKQAIASYVDKAFIVQSLDNNFNPRRAERFMAQILDAGIQPVLVLNKADLDFDKQAVDDAIKHIVRQIPVFFTSVRFSETIRELQESILEGETVVFVGSSGVGKSSLVNALCENSALAVSEISVSTGKGRHTSTRREMVLMKNSGVLIDTPGVREFGLAVDNSDSLAEMLDISDFEKSCRFADCTHTNEPGCTVLQAIENGRLDPKILESYQKLQREAWHFSTSEHEKRQRVKHFAKVTDNESYQKKLRQWNASQETGKEKKQKGGEKRNGLR
jgi:ribosome biogenesis GTPase